jgi:hypothetical protein
VEERKVEHEKPKNPHVNQSETNQRKDPGPVGAAEGSAVRDWTADERCTVVDVAEEQTPVVSDKNQCADSYHAACVSLPKLSR